MNSTKLKYFIVLLLGLIFIACGDKNSQSDLDGLKIDNITLSSSSVPLNSIQLVKVDINSPIDHISEINKTAVFIYFELTDLNITDENESDETIWLNSFALSDIKQGSNSYEFNITIPSDIDIGQYTLYAEVSDSQRSLDNNSSDVFDVISFGGKPELELVSLKLGIEDGGIDSEYDTINSYMDAGTSKAQEMLSKGISLDDLNETLIVDASIEVRSRYMKAHDVKVKVCVEVYSECTPIPILDMVNNNEPSLSHITEENATQSISLPAETFQLDLGDFDDNGKRSFDLHIVLGLEQFLGIINDAIQDLYTFSGGKIQGKLKVEISSADEGDLDLAVNVMSRSFNIMLSEEIYNIISNLQGSISLEDLQNIISFLDDSNSSDGLPDGLPDDLLGDLSGVSIAHSSMAIIPEKRSKRSVSGTCGLKKLKYEKQYDYNKYGKRFGAGAYLKGNAYLDAKGVHSSVYGSLRVRRFSDTKWRILRVKSSANIIPSSFEDTGYDIEISSLGVQIYAKSNSISEALGLDSPTVTLTEEEEEKIRRSNESNATDRNVTRRSTLLRQKAYKAAKKKIKQYGVTQSTLLSYQRGWRVGKIIERSTTIWFGPVPIVITAGADASIGFDAGIKLDGITSVTAMVEPNAYIGAYVEAGVGWGVSCCGKSIEYSAGFGGNLWLISERFTTTVNASLEFVEDDAGEYIIALDGKLHNNITNYLSTMKGEVYAYAKYTKWICKYRRHPCRSWNWRGHCTRRGSVCTSYGWKDYEKRKTFADWSGGRYTTELLDKKRTLFTVPIADHCE